MRRVLVYDDKAQLAAGVATAFHSHVVTALAAQEGLIHLALTGGSMGIASLAAIAQLPDSGIGWDRIHLWWGDERWLAADDPERNALQADHALLDHIAIAPQNVHRCPASDAGLTLDEAVTAYRTELARFDHAGWGHPAFELVFLGVGPDGHIASLFPGRPEIEVTEQPVIAVRNSPKPPPERLSLTRPVLNSAAHVWMVLAGLDKAVPLGLALAGASRNEVPAAGIKGRVETVYFADLDAAANVPANVTVRYSQSDRVGRD